MQVVASKNFSCGYLCILMKYLSSRVAMSLCAEWRILTTSSGFCMIGNTWTCLVESMCAAVLTLWVCSSYGDLQPLVT